MSTAMKGLLKGLRYISEIFEADEKEPEIQIGAPTDVKHVAHIGCDGPSTNAPSWMNEFQGSSEHGSSDLNGGSRDSMSSAGSPTRRGKSKQSKKQSAGTSTNSPDRDLKPRKSKTSNNDNESSRARRTKNSAMGSESPAQDLGAKKNRKKKRASNRDPSTTDNDNEPQENEMRLKQAQ